MTLAVPSHGLSTFPKSGAADTPSSSGTAPNSVAVSDNTPAVEILVPPLSSYKKLLIPREKKAGFFDEDAHGFLA